MVCVVCVCVRDGVCCCELLCCAALCCAVLCCVVVSYVPSMVDAQIQRFVPDDWRDKWLHTGRVRWGRAWIGIVLCRKNERRNTRTKNKGTNRDNLLRLSSVEPECCDAF